MATIRHNDIELDERVAPLFLDLKDRYCLGLMEVHASPDLDDHHVVLEVFGMDKARELLEDFMAAMPELRGDILNINQGRSCWQLLPVLSPFDCGHCSYVHVDWAAGISFPLAVLESLSEAVHASYGNHDDQRRKESQDLEQLLEP